MGHSYIGTERVPMRVSEKLADDVFGVPQIDSVIATMQEVCALRAGQVRLYFRDMQKVLAEILRVLHTGRPAALVVGDSVVRGVRVHTHLHMAALAEATVLNGCTFEIRAVLPRTIHRGRRQMPIKRGTSASGIETEFVLVLQKRRSRRVHPVSHVNSFNHSELCLSRVNGDEEWPG